LLPSFQRNVEVLGLYMVIFFQCFSCKVREIGEQLLLSVESLTNSEEQNHSWRASSRLASQEIPRLLWNLRLSAMFTRASTRFYPEWHESSQHSHTLISLRLVLLITSHLRQGLPSSLFSSTFLTKFLCAFLIS
jgi:hypothetical protein